VRVHAAHDREHTSTAVIIVLHSAEDVHITHES
jgi:hypothetical protein